MSLKVLAAADFSSSIRFHFRVTFRAFKPNILINFATWHVTQGKERALALSYLDCWAGLKAVLKTRMEKPRK